MKKLLKLLLPLVLVVSCTYELSIPESKLESYVCKEFPMKSEIFLSKVIVKNPDLKLLGNNKGEFSFDLEVVPPLGKEIDAKVDAIGAFQFDSKTKTLYLVDLKPKEVVLNGKKFESDLVNKTVNVIIRDVLKGIPVYKIEGKKAKLVKGIEIKRGKLVVKLGI